MRVATWNVNSVRVRILQIIEFIVEYDIDVILLQELKCVTEAFPYECIEDAGYSCAVYGQKTYNGVAIISRHLIDDIKLGSSIFLGDPSSRYIEAFINGFRIASVYVPNGGTDPSLEPYRYKLNFIRTFTDYLQTEIASDKFIIGGDFNVAREDIDVYDPRLWRDKVCCTPAEREAFQNLIDIGLVDIYRTTHAAKEGYTWWDYRQDSVSKNRGLRIDYILSTKGVNFKGVTVQRGVRTNPRPSDHAPVVVDVC